MQPQIRLAHRVSTHLLANLLVFAISVFNGAIGNRVHNMYALLTQLARERLRQLSDGSATSPVCSELRTATQRAEGAGEDQGLQSTADRLALHRQEAGHGSHTPFFSPPSASAVSP